ncbi:glycosyltransferase family 2 protein [Nitrincola alkalilacustris]|uniref:glycosyltransferase family 2 protein n=1 Tax=Nitrincola alkalilacustris TaxID=1571224 RepID=UPI00124EA817|nr:glycosyltransferase [Nitrincola alkalilacustris]
MSEQAGQHAIDVVIPVYRSLAATQRCIESVLSSRISSEVNVLVVDDASPEPELSAWCDRLSSEGKITLLRNEQNLGFVASVNRAMQQNTDRDVVLLNSDTQVSEGWLKRMQDAAASDPHIATVTPFSNNATICSYPLFCQSSGLPQGVSLAELDKLFAQANAGVYPDLPTGVGFCLYIRRVALDELGYFDEEAFGRGYGEETDFCMKASRAGWQNRLCADLFVYHEGAVSFGQDRDERIVHAEQIMQERYPEYRQQVSLFIDQDPLRTLRDKVDHLRLTLPDQARRILEEQQLHREWLLSGVAREKGQIKQDLQQTRDALSHTEQLLREAREAFAETDKALADAQRVVRDYEQELAALKQRWFVRIGRLFDIKLWISKFSGKL